MKVSERGKFLKNLSLPVKKYNKTMHKKQQKKGEKKAAILTIEDIMRDLEAKFEKIYDSDDD